MPLALIARTRATYTPGLALWMSALNPVSVPRDCHSPLSLRHSHSYFTALATAGHWMDSRIDASTCPAVSLLVSVTVDGPGCTLGGITLTGGTLNGSSKSIAPNLLALCCTALIVNDSCGPLLSSVTTTR